MDRRWLYLLPLGFLCTSIGSILWSAFLSDLQSTALIWISCSFLVYPTYLFAELLQSAKRGVA